MKKNVLLFEDIIDDLKDPSNKTWQTLFDWTKESGNENACFAALVKNSEEDIEDALKNCFRNSVHLDFSKPFFVKYENVIFYENEFHDFDTYYEPIVIFQEFERYWEDQIDLCEEFKLYHNLYFDSQKQEYMKINENGDKEVVAKIEIIGKRKRLKVKTFFLRDYLAAKEMVCVLFYDIRRSNKPSGTQKEENINEKTDNFHYTIVFKPDFSFFSNEESVDFSMIIGKTLLYPFPEPKHHEYLWYKNDEQEEQEEIKVIIGRDENGENVYANCTDSHYPSPHFSDSEVHHLRPVFFKKEVLEKYYENPDKYSVEAEIIRYGTKWSLIFNTNKEDLVHAYLGDLAMIPNNEKHHWKQYNVPPEGGISRVSFQRDFLAEPADTEDIIHILKAAYRKTNELWRDVFSFELFHSLREEDKPFFDSLMVPPTDSQLKFDRQILSLSKIFPDSLNKSGLLKTMNIDEEEIKKMLNILDESTIGSIKVFQAFLIKTFDLDIEASEKLVFPLTTTQTLRSYSAAHRKGKDFAKISNRFGLNNISNADFLEKLFSDFIETLQTLQESAVHLKK